MELQYIVLTIIKILISVPAIVVLINQQVDAAALIGGHVKNNVSKINGINTTDSFDFKIDLTDENSQEYPDNSTEAGNSEEVPDPSPLIVPGYNLPENIFNRGKPFYLEKDPLTGSVDFDSKASSLKVYDDYEYEDEDLPYDKSQIDRKDGPISGGHKPSDINQLTPNFHDFLNLPVKYNPDKYVYPLISSSYANTKVQGNVNKQHNHKNYEITTYKPTLSPTYFTTKNVYSQNKVIEYGQKSKDKYNFEATTKTYLNKNENTAQSNFHAEYPHKGSNFMNQPSFQAEYPNKGSNLMYSPMNHPSFQEEYPNSKKPQSFKEEYLTSKKPQEHPSSTTRPNPNYHSSTTSRLDNRGPNLMHSPMNHPSFLNEYPNSISTTSTSTSTSKPTTTTVKTTTKRAMSLFEQLFGSDYDDTTTEIDVTTKPTPPKLFDNLPSNKKTPTTTQNVLVGNMGYVEDENEYKERPTTKKEVDEYEYYDYQEKYPTTSKYQTTSVTDEKNPTASNEDKYLSKEKYPTGSLSNEKYPTGTLNNEKYPTGFSNNEKYPTGSSNNEKYPTGTANNEKYPTGSLSNEKYPTGSSHNEKYPTGSSNNEKYPTGSSNNEKYPTGSSNNENYYTTIFNGEKYPNNEKYPTGSSYNGKYPTALNGDKYQNNEKYSTGSYYNGKYPSPGFSSNEKYPTASKEDTYSTGFVNNEKYSPALNGNKYTTGSTNNERYPTTIFSRDTFETAATSSIFTTTTTEAPSTAQTFGTVTTNKKVTSLPLGENHVAHFHPVISSNNLREKLNAEKVVEQKYNSVVHPQAPSASNIHIAPDQDIVSFVVGNHQNVDGNEGNGGYIGSSLKESPYDNNPFRPVYSLAPTHEDAFRWTEPQRTTLNVQPARTTEPVLILKEENTNQGNLEQVIVVENEYPSVGNKIVFPTERPTTYSPDLSPPPPPKQALNILNREVLKLSSKPMFHQLPSDLTPPSEKEVLVPPRLDRERERDRERVRPPWDPRPGHFHAGRPEYARPPRPVPELYKRIDNLPNILPQFRPNMKVHHSHSHPHHHHHHHHQYQSKNYARQPLLDRPSNRPIGFFEKLHPPPLSKNEQKIIEDRIGLGTNKNLLQEPFAFLQAPPKVVVSNRRSGDDIETLQMIQAKKDKVEPVKSSLTTSLNGKDTLEKPLYVVYPVNTPPLKLDVLDTNKQESVVIGTRAELPLPPSKISQEKQESAADFKLEFKKPLSSPSNDFKSPISLPDFNYELSERHDAPILKPRPGSFPVKTDFPYPLERPDPSILNPETVEEIENNLPDEPVLVSSNQWNTIDDAQARIVNHNHNQNAQNQISVTLKTHTEKPIAVAYTPTESGLNKYTKEFLEAITSKNKYQDYHDRFSMPNYGGLVIPEIRPNSNPNPNPNSNSEITVSAVMHARPQQHQKVDRVDEDTTIPAQDFQAPFQASAHVDHSISQGWSIVKNKEEHKDEATTVPIATTSEFDIENFKPQLEGGFKPIYSFPEEQKDALVSEREE